MHRVRGPPPPGSRRIARKRKHLNVTNNQLGKKSVNAECDMLNCVYTNVDCLPNKFDEIKMITENPPMIIGLTEIKPKKFRYSFNVNEFNIGSYNLYICNVENNVGRRVILYTHKPLTFLSLSPKQKFKNQCG